MIKTIHEGYLVDEQGNVYSEYVSAGKHGLKKRRERKKLSPPISGNGYRYVKIKGKKYLVHRLVYETFRGKANKLVLHKDGNKLNNSIDNLYGGDHKDNAIDTVKHGSHPFTKLGVSDVNMIRKMLGRFKVKELAHMFCVSTHAIYNIKNNKTWKTL